MKLINVINANNVISNFVDESIDAQLAYKLMKFVTSTESEVEFFKLQMQKLVDKYSETDNDGTKHIPPANVEQFNDDAMKVQDTEVDAPAIRFSVAELAPLKMTMRQMFALSDFVDDQK